MDHLYIRFLIFGLLMILGQSQDMVQLRTGQDRHRTSSTLMWKPSKSGKMLPYDSVPVDKKVPSIVWCRARLNELFIPGEVKGKGKCKIAFLGHKPSYFDQFDVLISFNGSARIKLIPWDSFFTKPDNALQSPDRILAMVVSDTDRSVAAHIGTKSSDRSAISATVDDKVVKTCTVHVLVEDEPIMYTLYNIQYFTRYSMVNKRPVALNETILSNFDSQTKTVSTFLPYLVEESQYWGRPKGTITSLETEVETPAGKNFDIIWGTESPFNRVEFGRIYYELPPKSSVIVKLMGVIRNYEVNYKGTLEAVYGDKFTTSRTIEALHIDRTLTTVIAKYERPFYFDNTLVEDMEEKARLVFQLTTTTSTSSTTTTSTTTTSTIPPSTTTVTAATSILPDFFTAVRVKEIKLQPESLSKTPGEEKATIIESTESSSSTSDRVLTGISTIFTALVFWYFGLGA